MSKDSEAHFGTCCGCIPLRAGVVVYAVLIMVLSAMAFAGLVTEDTRLFVGGYTYNCRIAVAFLGVVCFFSSLCCLVGISDNAAPWVRSFCHVAGLRLLALAVIFFVDYRALQECEDYSPNGNKISSVHEDAYNVALSTLALSGKCRSTRELYIVLMILDLILSLYGYFMLQRFAYLVETCPTFLIHINETKPIHMYTGYSGMSNPIQAGGEATRPILMPYGAGNQAVP